MNKELLKQIIIESHEFIRDLEIVPRSLVLEENGNYVFVGSRRSGKTYSIFQIIKNMIPKDVPLSAILYINFEDERLMELTGGELGLILEAHQELFSDKPVLFLDEIQNIDGWEKFARRMADTGYRIFITGSNAKMLSSEIATTLGARFLIKKIFPLSFHEYLQMNKLELEDNWEYSSQRFEIRRMFDEYFYYGGFPEIIRFQEKRMWLDNLFQKIFFGDLVARYKIRNDFALRLMIKKLAESIQDEVTISRIRNIIQSTGIKIGTNTLFEYIDFMKETWLIHGIKNYLSIISERETSGKYYFVDNGILSLFLMNAETILLENIVACQLIRLYGDGVFYLRSKSEVDFYIPENQQLIQVCYKINLAETEKREVDALISASQNVKTKEMLIITFDTEKVKEVNGFQIRFVPVWKWLLKE